MEGGAVPNGVPSALAAPARPRAHANSHSIDHLLDNNRQWAARTIAADPAFFHRLKDGQSPKYMWIGCADSRVPANQLVGLPPGSIFVQRNVGNQASHRDLNCMACLEYAVNVLGVQHVIVSGHYGCGAVNAALTMPQRTEGLVGFWIQDIRDLRDSHSEELVEIAEQGEQVNRLCELNVIRQVFNVCTSPIVAGAWERGCQLAIHGIVYDVATGVIKEVINRITCMTEFERLAYEHEKTRTFAHRVRISKMFEDKMRLGNGGGAPSSSGSGGSSPAAAAKAAHAMSPAARAFAGAG